MNRDGPYFGERRQTCVYVPAEAYILKLMKQGYTLAAARDFAGQLPQRMDGRFVMVRREEMTRSGVGGDTFVSGLASITMEEYTTAEPGADTSSRAWASAGAGASPGAGPSTGARTSTIGAEGRSFVPEEGLPDTSNVPEQVDSDDAETVVGGSDEE